MRIPSLSFQRHLSEDELLAYLDGELAGGKARITKRHLESCWECRDQAHRLEETISEILRFRKLRQRHAPASDERLFQARLAGRAQSTGQSFALRTLAGALRWPLLAGTGVAAILLMIPPGRAKVTPSEVFSKAIEAQRGRDQSYSALKVRGDAEELRGMLRHTAWSGNSAFSAAAARQWRDGLSAKQEEVSETVSNDGEAALALTVTDEGAAREAAGSLQLRQVVLLVRKSDGKPLKEDFRFLNGGVEKRFEVTAASANTAQPQPPKEIAVATLPAKPAQKLAPVLPSPSVGELEVEIRYALHRARACLGEAVEIVVDQNGRIVVGGMVETAERKQELTRILGRIPGIRLNLNEKSEIPYPAQRFRTARASRAGSRPPEPEDSTDVEEVWALRRLATLYPNARVKKLSVRSQWLVEAMLSDHIAKLESSIGPVPESGEAEDPEDSASADTAGRGGRRVWNLEVEELFNAVAGYKQPGETGNSREANTRLRRQLRAVSRAIAEDFTLIPEFAALPPARAVITSNK